MNCKFVVVGHLTPTDASESEAAGELNAFGFQTREEAQEWIDGSGGLWWRDAEIAELSDPPGRP